MDYYKILGVNKGSSEDEIKQSFRSLAKIHHPDKGGNKEKFQEKYIREIRCGFKVIVQTKYIRTKNIHLKQSFFFKLIIFAVY